MNDNSPQPSTQQSERDNAIFVHVMDGPVPFKDIGIPNLSDIYKGQVLTNNNKLQPAILKDIPIREMANELFAYGLANNLGLPVPKSYIGITPANSTYANQVRLSDGRGLMFVSIDVKLPSIAQIIKAPDQNESLKLLKPIADFISQQSWLGDLYGFDAWVANVDRHVGNVLVHSMTSAWLIDHGRCFTGQNWTTSDLIPSGIFRNRLKEWLTIFLTSSRRRALANQAACLAARLPAIPTKEIGVQIRIPDLLGDGDFQALVDFLSDRIIHVAGASGDALNEARIA